MALGIYQAVSWNFVANPQWYETANELCTKPFEMPLLRKVSKNFVFEQVTAQFILEYY